MGDPLQQHLSQALREEQKWCKRIAFTFLLVCLAVPLCIVFTEERQRALGNYHSALATLKYCQGGLHSVLSFTPDEPMNLCAHAARLSMSSPFLAAAYRTLDRMGLGFVARVMMHSVENAIYSAIVYSAIGYVLVRACWCYKGTRHDSPPTSFYSHFPAHVPDYLVNIPSARRRSSATLSLLPEDESEECKHTHHD